LQPRRKLSAPSPAIKRSLIAEPDASILGERAYVSDSPPGPDRTSRILVTGGAGFIGSHLVQRLVAEGYQAVTVVDNLSRGRTANLSAVWESVSFVKADIRNYSAVARLVRNSDVVFHLAAQSNVIGAVQDVDYSSSTNVVGTATILQAARAAGVRRLVFTSSREVYGDPSAVPVPEIAPLCPKNAYGMSKVAGEMCCTMSTGSSLETVILRLANVYGSRDRDRVVPLFVESALNGRPLQVYGGRQILDFVHVDHVVNALVTVGFGKHIDCPVNVGSGKGITIIELAKRILDLTNSDSEIAWMPSRKVEVVRFVADTSRARRLLGLDHQGDPLARLPEVIAWAGIEGCPGREILRRVAV
jgi:UDP-glucose 4-epimerase